MDMPHMRNMYKNKTRGANQKAPLSHFGPASEPFEIIFLDTIGGFTGYKSTKKILAFDCRQLFKIRVHRYVKNANG